MTFKIMCVAARQGLPAIALVFALGCPTPRPAQDAGPVLLEDGGLAATRADFLGAAGTCSLQAVAKFRAEIDALNTAPTQDNWKKAMKAWQRVEVMQFGPTGSASTPGGMDLRDQVYSWPLVSRCAIEDVLVSKRYESGVGSLLVNRRGLATLEYLLFYGGDDVLCSSAGWAALTPAERAAQKQAYAVAVSADLKVHADALVTAWEGGFVETLRTAGPGNTTYMSTGAAMNQVSNAVFYIERVVKDLKLAPPLGLRDCAAPPCVELLESQYAAHNTANLRENVAAMRQLLEGCEPGFTGIGFDDLLLGARASSLVERLHERLLAAEAALAAIEEPDLKEALMNDPASVRAFYDSLKAITDLLKSEFVTVLDIDLPMGLEGDND